MNCQLEDLTLRYAMLRLTGDDAGYEIEAFLFCFFFVIEFA